MAGAIRLSAKRKAAVEPVEPPGPARPPPAKRVVIQSPGGWDGSFSSPEGTGSDIGANIGADLGGPLPKADRASLFSLFTDCMSALSSNKICSRNAFEIGIIDHIDDLVALRNEGPEADVNDVCFSTASRVVEGASRVYGYRVEAVYDKTFNVLMNIQTTEKEQRRVKATRRRAHEFSGTNTLLPEAEVTLPELPVEPVLMDPFFLRVSSLFDQSGPQGLLLVNLMVDANLELSLSSFGAPMAPEGAIGSQGGPETPEASETGPEAPDDADGPSGADEDINLPLISQLVGDFEHLEILPELDVYLETSEIPPDLPMLSDKPGPDGPLAPVDSTNPWDDTPMADAMGSPFGDMSPGALSGPLSDFGGVSPTGDSMDSEFFDALEFDEAAGPEQAVLSRVSAMDTSQDMSYYGANGATAALGPPGPPRQTVPRTRTKKPREKAPKATPQSAEHFILTSDLNEVLDSIELMSGQATGPDKEVGRPAAAGPLGPGIAIDIDQLAQKVHTCPPLPWPLAASAQGGDWASDYGPDDWASGPDGAEEWANGPEDYPDSPEAAGTAFVDIALLKGSIMDFVMGNGSPSGALSAPMDQRGPEGHGGISFTNLIEHVRRRVNRTVGVHIVFVCLLHVCNEAGLRLTQPEPDDFLITVDNV